jgi:uncharacterized membrane protein YebE (DUF533 family)
VNDLDIEGLVGGVLRGVLGSRGKRSHGTLRYLTGGGPSSFLNASTLLAVAGVAWGLWETAQQQSAVSATPAARPLATPPLPQSASPVTPATVQPDVLRVLRLTLAAARADGTLEPRERDAILARAKQVGAEPLIAAEVDRPKDLGEIVDAVDDERMRQDLYTLAYAIVRADEQVSDRERSWLTELAGHLRVDAGTVAGLEHQAASRIAAAAQGAPR